MCILVLTEVFGRVQYKLFNDKYLERPTLWPDVLDNADASVEPLRTMPEAMH